MYPGYYTYTPTRLRKAERNYLKQGKKHNRLFQSISSRRTYLKQGHKIKNQLFKSMSTMNFFRQGQKNNQLFKSISNRNKKFIYSLNQSKFEKHLKHGKKEVQLFQLKSLKLLLKVRKRIDDSNHFQVGAILNNARKRINSKII